MFRTSLSVKPFCSLYQCSAIMTAICCYIMQHYNDMFDFTWKYSMSVPYEKAKNWSIVEAVGIQGFSLTQESFVAFVICLWLLPALSTCTVTHRPNTHCVLCELSSTYNWISIFWANRLGPRTKSSHCKIDLECSTHLSKVNPENLLQLQNMLWLH